MTLRLASSTSTAFPSSQTVTPTDAQLMQAIARGDMVAFSTLIRRHQHRARLLACRLTGSADAADDITQDAFLRVFRSAHSYRPTAAFTTWLHRIVVNLCLDRAKRPQLAPIPEEGPEVTSEPDSHLSHDERIQAIRREIDALPPRQRIALVLHRFEGQTHAQIAEATGWSVSAVEALLVRAYAQLREKLKGWKP
jgi:RNA polymerase sigma-70 factor (ECF subfamily)